METMIYLFVAAVALAGLMCSVTIWAPRRLAVKVAALGLAAAVLPLGYASMAGLLSKPKPVRLEWLRTAATEASVLSASIREGRGIYLLLALPDAEEPRYYVLPWNEEMARQLQEARREAEDSGAQLAMREPFEGERSIAEGQPKFYAKPQPAPPPKRYEPPAMQYRHPSNET